VEEHAAVAAVEGHPTEAVDRRRGEWELGCGGGDEALVVEKAEHGGCSVVLAVEAKEAGFGEEEVPGPTDEGGTGKARRLVRGEATEDLADDIVGQCRQRNW